MIVVDRNFAVSAWSESAADTWGLREDEVRGQNFLGLDIGIPTGELRDPIRAVLGGNDPPDLLLTGHDRRGRRVVCTASFAQLHGPMGDVHGAIVVMTVEATEG